MSTRFFISCLTVASGVFSLVELNQTEQNTTPKVAPKRFIIEYASHVDDFNSNADGLDAHDNITVLKSFDSSLFSGVSVETDTFTMESLTQLPNVARVWPNDPVELLVPVTPKRQVDVDADSAHQHTVHWATGVDQVHQQGFLGQGVKVGVVDTGVWYDHNALGGGFGDGFKIAGGWDFVGDEWNGDDGFAPDADPLDQQGHGTHVAGIIAGESVETGWKGVAPNATIFAYKVFGASGGSSTDVVIEAFLKAYADGVDVITASIGGRGGFAENAWAVVASRIADEGVVVTIGAGNYGAGGPYYASSGSSGASVLSVASAEVKRSAANGGSGSGVEDTIQPSFFTSWGGLYDLSVKPDITAPGTDIYSTWYGGDNNEYVLLSGTSMATPYIAGVAALYISKHGGRAVHGNKIAKDLSMRILSSGTSLPWLNQDRAADHDFKAPTHQVGGGLVDARKVVDYKTHVDLNRFALNDTANFQASQSVTILNAADHPVTYSFEAEPCAGFDMLHLDPDDLNETPRIRYSSEMVPIETGVNVTLSASFELAANESRTANFAFEVPTGLDETTLPSYSGRISIKSSTNETIAVPYQGLGFGLQEKMQNMFAGSYPWLRSTSAYSNKTTFTFNQTTGSQDFPMMFAKLNWGTREVRWDIYGRDFDEAKDWMYPPTLGSNEYIGSVAPWAGSGSFSTFNPARHNASDTFTLPVQNQARNALVSGGFTTTYFWFGKLGNGSYIEPGDYT